MVALTTLITPMWLKKVYDKEDTVLNLGEKSSKKTK
jgi:hypothetical protein